MKALLIDANLLVLLIVGGANPIYIKKNRNTSKYALADFETLEQTISDYASVVVTPTVLAEVSNLAGQMGEPARSEVMMQLRHMIGHRPEINVECRVAAARPEFIRLGLADASILALCLDNLDALALLTHDGPLATAAHALRITVIDFEGRR